MTAGTVVEDVGDEEVGVEEGELVGLDAVDVGLGELVGGAEVADVAIDDPVGDLDCTAPITPFACTESRLHRI